MCYPREKALCVKKVDYWKNGLNAFTSVLRWFASDIAYFCFHPYNIFGEVSVHFYGEEQSFLKAGYSVLIAMMFTFNYWLMLTVMTLKQFFTWQYATSVQACFNMQNFLAPQDTTTTAFVFIMINFNYYKQTILSGRSYSKLYLF